MERRHTEE
ncbi:hypothetical protein MAR_034138 [Mya arenaria]|uniref:Uncharacterized protein n=1 Tax=Mya arenaria TaxID=6604 RepID=A0ABY7GES0_MYAAR|nr:hypothetical protein MAR_034138 [Mya arenaria]